jgi:predicted dehydrogenase
MKSINRRDFVRSSLLSSAALALSQSRILGANDDIRIAVVGIRSKGKEHIELFRNTPGVRIVALCDVDKDILDQGAQKFKDRGEKIDLYADVRKLLEDKNVDAIVVATPNHWHSLIGIWGCQADKDVYVEKPVSHDIWEGRRLVEAARKYNRIVEAGTQSRSDEGLMAIRDYLKQGSLGKILYARGLCYKPRPSIGKVTGPQPVPPSVDYDLWCGPAPKEPLMRQQLHYDWHWFWATGNGDIGNQGIHEMDKCRWLIGQQGLPPRVMSFGGRLGYIDDGQTANTQVAILDYRPAPIIFEVRGLPAKAGVRYMDHYRGIDIGEVIQCEGGYIAGDFAYDNDGKKIRQFNRDGGAKHHLNFLQAVRSRKASELNAPIEECHFSSALCHMANISYRLGQPAGGEAIVKGLEKNSMLMDSFERFQEHLLLNEVSVSKTPRILGPWLEMNASAEKFTGEWAEKANSQLRRECRAPFVVPEKV